MYTVISHSLLKFVLEATIGELIKIMNWEKNEILILSVWFQFEPIDTECSIVKFYSGYGEKSALEMSVYSFLQLSSHSTIGR